MSDEAADSLLNESIDSVDEVDFEKEEHDTEVHDDKESDPEVHNDEESDPEVHDDKESDTEDKSSGLEIAEDEGIEKADVKEQDVKYEEADEHNDSLEEGEHSLEEGEHEESEGEICEKTELLNVSEGELSDNDLDEKDEEKLDNSINDTNQKDRIRGESDEDSPHKNKNGEDVQNSKYSLYDVSDVQSSDLNSSFMSGDANKENEGEAKSNKRKSDEGLELRDELDFEEEKESGEEGEDSDGETEPKRKVVINKEEGELSEEDEDDSSLRQEPKTVCRFFNKGQCTWGTNCRFLHPGVSDKGNYNMFAAPKPESQAEKDETAVDKERPQEVRRYVPEPAGFESAWERGLRHAKEMMKRANKRKETDADFEEKRFNLSLGQAELDRENDYYTRPASPVYKPSDEVIEYLDPYEKQAIRHFRGGHFENFEVRYKVDQAYPNRGPEHIRSRRDKFEREVTERIPRRMRGATSPAPVEEPHNKTVKEKRYPRPRTWKEERAQEVPATSVQGKEAEVWADPWARRKTPPKKAKKIPRNRSYSSGSSSRSSRSSRSSSYSSYSRSGSRSSSRSSRSSSRSIAPPIHPRQQRATMNRGGGRGGRGRGMDRGGRGGGPPRNFYQAPQFSQPPNPPPNHPLAPDVNFLRQNAPGGMGNRQGRGRDDNRFMNSRLQDTRNVHPGPGLKERVPPMQFKQEPRFSVEPRERFATPRKIEPRAAQTDQHERVANPREVKPRVAQTDQHERPPPSFQRNPDARPKPAEARERVDMFGRTIRKEIPKSPSKSPKRHAAKPHGRRRFSLSPSRSRSGSGSSSGSSGSRSRSGSRSASGSRSSHSSASPPPSPVNKRKEKVRRTNQPPQPPGTVSYGETVKSKAIDLVKVAGQKQQIKLTLKKPGLAAKPIDKTVLDVDDDSGESDTDARILKKRKVDAAPANPPPAKKPRVPSPTALASLTTGTVGVKKPSAARREELLKQLRAVEDAIARKRSKPL